METICLHAYVSGKVQGVFFRRATAEKGRQFGLGGWVKNLPDGRVEVKICGKRPVAEAFCDWLRIGPPTAKVSQVEVEEILCEVIENFEIR